jgi:hypothetical protein
VQREKFVCKFCVEPSLLTTGFGGRKKFADWK